MPLRVLQIIDSLGMGGAETWLMAVLRLWSETGTAQMDFVITSGNRGIFDAEAERLGARLHYVRYRRQCLPTFVRELRRILREGRYQAVHDHQDFVSGWHFVAGAGRLPRVRIAHVHNPYYQIEHNYGISFTRRVSVHIGKQLIRRFATIVVGTSQRTLEENGFCRPAFDRIPKAVLHCGFRLTRFSGDSRNARIAVCREFGWPDEAPIVLFAGRLDASLDFSHPRNHKNSSFAVAVFRACLEREPEAKMIMVGANEHVRDVFMNHLSSQGLAHAVVLAGIRSDIEKLMLASRVLLFPSRAEGLGMVAVEAQAAGLLVTASTSVPNECVVLPDLVSFHDLSAPIDQWAEAVVRALRVPRALPTVSNDSWRGSGFDIRISAARLQELYQTGLVGTAAYQMRADV
ncbi:MAG: hypothetical protein DMF90_25275 [Acidobacteria bacterium]|nr:MAG: hypothetical protein DMF90_25275 [Acidobacteriota bacterium]